MCVCVLYDKIYIFSVALDFMDCVALFLLFFFQSINMSLNIEFTTRRTLQFKFFFLVAAAAVDDMHNI